jgi:hypothetical protein
VKNDGSSTKIGAVLERSALCGTIPHYSFTEGLGRIGMQY